MVQHQRDRSEPGASGQGIGDYRNPTPGVLPLGPLLISRGQGTSGGVPCAVNQRQPGMTHRNLSLESFRSQFLHDVSFDHIAVLDITEIFQGNAAFEPGPHFGGIVFEPA